jgi:integrase/recombinase XerD
MRIPDQETIDRLLAVIPERSPWGLRDHAMIRLALYTGLRVAELTGLTIQDVYTDTPRKMLDLPYKIAKGRRSRRINLSEKAQTAIQDLVDFLHLRGLNTQPDAPILQDRRHQKLPPREVQRAIQKYREIANLDLDITPHSLRHAFATDSTFIAPRLRHRLRQKGPHLHGPTAARTQRHRIHHHLPPRLRSRLRKNGGPLT